MPDIQFQFRRGTAFEWSVANPILLGGEMGIETDTGQFKIGDGIKNWNSLSYGGIRGPAGTPGEQGLRGESSPFTEMDKVKLDTIQSNANNYIHPTLHEPNIIRQDSQNRFVTDAEKTSWNAKQPAGTYATGTGTAYGSNTGDQTNIPGNAGSATVLQNSRLINGVAFNGSSNITINAVDSTPRVAQSLVAAPNGIATLDGLGKVPVSQLPDSVNNVLEFANFAAFPALGVSGCLYISLNDNKVYRWSGLNYTNITTGAVDSVAGKTGAVVLNKGDVGLSNVDNTSDANKPISNAQAEAISALQNSINTSIAQTAPLSHVGSRGSLAHAAATAADSGFMSASDKAKIDGISSGATANSTDAQLRDRSTHTGAQTIATVTGLQSTLDGKADFAHTHPGASNTLAGFMTTADKVKLDGIQSGAIAYVHPSNHPASVITQDANNRFVTDAEKMSWNAKIGSVKTINGQSITGSGDLVIAPPSTFGTDIAVNNVTIGKGGGNKISNTICGTDVLYSNTTGFQNTASGYCALRMNTTGNSNTASGHYALYNNTTGGNNSAFGMSALFLSTAGFGNSAFGVGALYKATTANYNSAFGAYSLQENTTGNNNTASGYEALRSNTTGFSNTAFGVSSLTNNTTASNNSAFGISALTANTTGENNVAFGTQALGSNVSASQNTAIGVSAMLLNTTGMRNTAVGRGALQNNTTGSDNIAIGSIFNANGSNPVFNVTTENNRIVMGHTAITNAYVQVAWTVVSDARDKTNFAPIPHGLDFVKQLKPTSYQFRTSRESEETNGGVRYGFKAQDIAAIEPEGVIIDASNPEKLYYNEGNMVPVLVRALQELSAKNDALEARLKALEAK